MKRDVNLNNTYWRGDSDGDMPPCYRVGAQDASASENIQKIIRPFLISSSYVNQSKETCKKDSVEATEVVPHSFLKEVDFS